MSAILLATLPLSGCGNALDGGSSPSGAYISAEVTPQVLEQDIYLTICTTTIDTDTGEVTYTYEDGITEGQATVTIHNDSRPNTPDGDSTNSDVTMSRYRVDYTGINKTVSIASFDGAGGSVVVPKDGSAEMTVLVMPYATQEYIRSHYPKIGNGESLSLRATITIWGEDTFEVTVSKTVELTVTVENFDRC